LGEISSSFEYGINAAAKAFDGNNKYIRITDIDDETRLFLKSDLTSPDIDLKNAEKYILQEGDIEILSLLGLGQVLEKPIFTRFLMVSCTMRVS